LSLMNFQMMRVISSPSISTTGVFTLIFVGMGAVLYHRAPARGRGSGRSRSAGYACAGGSFPVLRSHATVRASPSASGVKVRPSSAVARCADG